MTESVWWLKKNDINQIKHQMEGCDHLRVGSWFVRGAHIASFELESNVKIREVKKYSVVHLSQYCCLNNSL